MTGSAFSKGIKQLESAFRQQPLSKASLKIYFEKLQDVGDDIWQSAIDDIISTEDFFPSIACLLAHCASSGQLDTSGRPLPKSKPRSAEGTI